ncbi:hypothetical protein NIES4074_39040 [Cylindrospermum sp. NIES-4074]|nr:hypothetical protein NIES4074_39040 [Cylindrospermum sp. NIES-4074]
MGVYHLMGLGRSPGVITSPISYLTYRYQRWNAEDQDFFSRSGEAVQRQAGHKVGDIQSLVLFTTPEVIAGKEEATGKPFYSFNYVENSPGRIAEKPEYPPRKMKEVLHHLLKKEYPKISAGRQELPIFWVEVDRRDIYSTYNRIIQVITALANVGGQGKEMWVNLTGGNNVTNFALQLAATLSGEVARLYYVQAETQAAEKCVWFTSETNYWTELPVMPLVLSQLNIAVLNILEQQKCMSANTLYSYLHQTYWNLVQEVSEETFKQTSLVPMWKQGLISGEENAYIIGSQWKIIQPYQQLLQEAQNKSLTLEKLAQDETETWIEREVLQLN